MNVQYFPLSRVNDLCATRARYQKPLKRERKNAMSKVMTAPHPKAAPLVIPVSLPAKIFEEDDRDGFLDRIIPLVGRWVEVFLSHEDASAEHEKGWLNVCDDEDEGYKILVTRGAVPQMIVEPTRIRDFVFAAYEESCEGKTPVLVFKMDGKKGKTA